MTETGRAGPDVPVPGHPDRGPKSSGSPPDSARARRRRVRRVQRAGAGGRRQGVPRGRPQRRRDPPGRPGEAGAAGAQARHVRGQPGRLRRHRDLGLADRHGRPATLPIPRYDGLVQVLAPNGRREVASWTFVRALPEQGDRADAERQDRRDRDRGAAHRARGSAAGGRREPDRRRRAEPGQGQAVQAHRRPSRTARPTSRHRSSRTAQPSRSSSTRPA